MVVQGFKNLPEVALMLLTRTEHGRGNPSNQTAGNNTLGLRSQVVAQARDDVTLAGSKGLQSGSRHLFGSFLIFGGELLLAGDGVKLRFRGAGTQGADTNAVGLHLLGQAFGEEEIEGFR